MHVGDCKSGPFHQEIGSGIFKFFCFSDQIPQNRIL